MAKKKTTKSIPPSRSAAIVDYVQKNPTAKNAEVASALNEKHGLDIKPGYVATIKSQKGLTKGRTRRKKTVATKSVKQAGRPKTAKTTKTSELSLSQLQNAKQFADQVGGVEQARKTLEALAELQG